VRSVNPGGGKVRRRQHVIAGIGVQVVLFGRHLKIGNPVRDGMGIAPVYVDRVFHSVVARVSDPLTAGHKLPLGIGSEGVAHSTMAAGDSNAMFSDRPENRVALRGCDFAHRVDGDEQRHRGHLFFVGKSVQGIRNLDVKAFSLQKLLEEQRHFFRLMPVPSTPYDQCAFSHRGLKVTGNLDSLRSSLLPLSRFAFVPQTYRPLPRRGEVWGLERPDLGAVIRLSQAVLGGFLNVGLDLRLRFRWRGDGTLRFGAELYVPARRQD